MLSEMELVNILEHFKKELPEYFSPYNASELMPGSYDSNLNDLEYMHRAGFLDKNVKGQFKINEKGFKHISKRKKELRKKEIEQRIINFLKHHPRQDNESVGKHLNRSKERAYGFLNDMKKRGLLQVEKNGRKNVYSLPSNEPKEPVMEPEPEIQYVEIHEPGEVLNSSCQEIGMFIRDKLSPGELIDKLQTHIREAHYVKQTPNQNILKLNFENQEAIIDSFNDLPSELQDHTTITMDPYRKTYKMDIIFQ